VLKTLGNGKQPGANLEADWGSIQILIFPAGTVIPAVKPAQAANSSATDAGKPLPVAASATQNP
jgi:hypothetical protein